jgi:hypothetical protein
MKVKVAKVTVGIYDYDSILVKIDGKDTEIAFKKEDKVSQYEGKEVELTNDKGVYKIKPASSKKND